MYDRAVRHHEPAPVRPHQHAVERRPARPLRAMRASARCRRRIGSSPSRGRGRRRSDSRCAPPAPAPRRRGATCRPQHRPTSAARRSPHRACASAARPRTARTAPRTRPSASQRRRTTPLAQQRRGDSRGNHPQAVALIAFEQPHCARQYMTLEPRQGLRASETVAGREERAVRARRPRRRGRRSRGSPRRPRGATAPRARSACRAARSPPARSSHRAAADDEALAEPVDALMMVGLGDVHGLAGSARGERVLGRGARRARRRRRSRSRAGARRGRSARAGAGCSVPPRATLISCMPRQMPSTGRSRSIARAHERDLEGVALGHRADGLRVRGAP